jgi:thiol-disulfide isomerase/thioredoxin
MSEDKVADGRLSHRGYLWVAALAALAGFGAVYFTARGPDNAGVTGVTGTRGDIPKPDGTEINAFVRKAVPETLPAFSFQDGSGKTLTIADFKGKVVLLNLWATWCAPCRLEMPSLDRLQKAMGSGKFEVVALSLDRGGQAAAQKFLTEIKAETLKLYVDPTGKEGFNLKPIGLPTTLLIDAEGREIGRLTGPAEWDDAPAKALIAAELK